MKSLLILLLLVTTVLSSGAQKVFDFNGQCQQAYNEIISLKLGSGQMIINAEKAKNPSNLIPVLLENYIDFFTLFFNEDPAEYKNRSSLKDKRLNLLSTGPKNSPYYLFSLALVHFQWAVVQIKFGDNWNAGWEFRRAFIQVRDNETKFPGFLPNQMYRGAMQVAAGTIPDGYKWLSSLLGIRGSIENGMTNIRSFLKSQDFSAKLFRNEGIFYYCYLSYYIENNKNGVLQFIRDEKLDTKNNHLFAYLGTNLSIHNQQAEQALNYLDSRSDQPGYFATPVWDFEKGYVLMYKADPHAKEYFKNFVQNFKGKFYLKDALQKISWLYYLDGDMARANYYRQLVLTRGGAESEADKQALQEAKTSAWPDKLLLRARLFSDGGYQREALRLLHGKSANDFNGEANKLEFYYRTARVYDESGNDDEALRFYSYALSAGASRREYYAARAALQSAFIYEAKKNYREAIYWYKKTLSLKDHEFKNSIDQRAKAGIDRVENLMKKK